jgi:hypothetical protein
MAISIPFLIVITGFLLKFGKWFNFIWKFVVMLAGKPGTWFVVQFLPLILIIIEAITGKPTIVSTFVNNLILEVISKLLSVSINVDLQALIDQIPANIIQMWCYLGFSENLNLYWNGIVSAIQMFIIMRINIMVTKVKFKSIARPIGWHI